MKKKIIIMLMTLVIVIGNINVSFAETDSKLKTIEAKKTPDVRLIWSDEFDGTTLDSSKWEGVTGPAGYGSNEPLSYYMECCEVKDGNLIIKPQFQWNKSTQRIVNNSIKSSKIWTKGLYNFKYGKIEIRAKLPKGQGTYAAGLMLGANNSWPIGGEIDIFETGIESKSQILQSLHCNRFNGMSNSEEQKYKSTNVMDATSEYHIYGVIWDKDKITYTIDGKETWTYNPSTYIDSKNIIDNDIWPFDQPFYLNISCDIGKSYCGTLTPSNWTKIATNGDIETYEDYYYVDYIKVYDLEEYVPYVKPTKPVAKVKGLKVTNKKVRKVKLTWKKVVNAKGYQITYARNKKFTKGKKKILTKKRKHTVKKLQKKKTYYFKVRAYKVENRRKVYGLYSKVKKVRIKK